MIRSICISLVMIGLASMAAAAAGIKEIELNDGSVITGEVLSLAGGVYTIRTDSLGTLKIDDAKVRAIRQQGAPSSASTGQGGDAKALQNKMMNDQEIMGMIQSLKDDPQFTKVLEDPEIMNAVNSGDMASLMANPKFIQLLQNPTVRDIQKKAAK